MATVREASAITKKQLALRELHWPGAEPHLWHRLANKGFATIPKTMPMILKIMDEMTKGAPVLLDLPHPVVQHLGQFVCRTQQAWGYGERVRLWWPARGAHLGDPNEEAQ